MIKKLVLLLVINVVAISLHGYVFSTGDQSTYVPQVIKRINPSLYQRDYLANITEGNLIILFPLVAQIIKFTGVELEWLYFALYVATHLCVVALIYFVSKRLTKKNSAAWLATLFLALPKFVGGTNNPTLDTALLPRFVTLPLFLITLYLLSQRRYVFSALLIGIIVLLHPYTAVYVGLFLIGFIALDRQWQIIPVVLLVGLLPNAWFILPQLSEFRGDSPSLVMNRDWLMIALSRQPYNFITTWTLGSWLTLLVPLALAAAYLRRVRSTKNPRHFNLHQLLRLSVGIAFLVTAAHVILGEILHVALVLQLQLLRVWLIPIYLAYIATAHLIITLVKSERFATKIFAIVLASVIIVNFGKLNWGTVEMPGSPKREWDDLQVWVRNNTPRDSLLLTPPTRAGFRIHSQRAIVGEYKDGSSGLYSRKLALEWQKRMSDLWWLNHKTEAEIISLKQKYHADYLVTFKPQSYPSFMPVFETPTFIIYNLSSPRE